MVEHLLDHWSNFLFLWGFPTVLIIQLIHQAERLRLYDQAEKAWKYFWLLQITIVSFLATILVVYFYNKLVGNFPMYEMSDYPKWIFVPMIVIVWGAGHYLFRPREFDHLEKG